MSSAAELVRKRLESLSPTHVDVSDISDGCGIKLLVTIVSDHFDGKSLLQRHRMVNALLAEEMKSIHAISLTTLTPLQWTSKK